jgi:hypothetical protein
VDNSEEFQEEQGEWFISEKARHGGDHVEDEVPEEVVVSNRVEVLVCSGLLDEVEEDFNKVDDVESDLNLVKSLILVEISAVRATWAFLVVATPLINRLENKDIWRHKEGVDGQDGDHEVPDLAEVSFSVYKIPWDLLDVLRLGRVFLGVVIDIVNHHLF